MSDDLSPRDLTWADVDPRHHPFDPATAADVVRSLEPARHLPLRLPPGTPWFPDIRWIDDVAAPWGDAMTAALAERYGPWALGWRWARGEGDVDGGPVTSWCCPSHSITDPESTLGRVTAGLCEWRAWVEELAAAFELHAVDSDGGPDDRVRWRGAVRDLVDLVVDRTESDSAWYDHCELVLRWYLERWDVDPAAARRRVEDAIGGRFESWTAPDPGRVDEVAEQVSGALPAPSPTTTATPDHLARWLEVREQVEWAPAEPEPAPPRRRPERDAVADHIRAFDAVVDPARGEGLLAALDLVRADAERGAPLDFELLRGWQEHVLGTPRPPFRTQPAWAKRGRERYGIGPDTRTRLDSCLAESSPTGNRPLSLAARAARAHLDVCFVHPFDDGNARAAFLTLLFVLHREGVVPSGVLLLRNYSFAADDPADALWLQGVVERYVAEP